MNFLLPRCERCKGLLGPNHNEQDCVRRATAGVNRRYFFGALFSAAATLTLPTIVLKKDDRVHLIDLYGFNIPEGFASPQLRVSDGKIYRFHRENPFHFQVEINTLIPKNEVWFVGQKRIDKIVNIGTKECL